jgi:hypothetical protein
MTQLNQILAVEKGVKSRTEKDLTAAYHALQRTNALAGLSRTYEPKDEDGDKLPSESTNVQVKVEDVLKDVAQAATNLFDVTFTKEATNTEAKADIVVDGTALLKDVPVTYLLFLEKQLVNLHTLVSKLPTLDPAETWSLNVANGVFETAPTQTTKSKKVPRNWVKAEATDKHPAQVEIFHEDVVVGYWTIRKFSGAVPSTRVTELVDRVEKLQNAVKFAREAANGTEVTDRKAGETIFGYLFA